MCGRSPAVQITATKQTGLLIVHRTSTWEGRACQDCGTSIVRKAMAHNLLAGWWGPLSLVTNPFTIIGNLLARRALKRVGPPQGAPLGAPRRPVRPLWQKPWLFAVPIAFVAIVVAGIVSAATHTNMDELATGACFDFPDTVGMSKTVDADCSAPHDAEVIGKISTGSQLPGVDGCEAVAVDYLGGTSGIERLQVQGNALGQDKTICIVASVDGSKLTATVKGTGR